MKRTPARHRMLREVAAGRMSVHIRLQWNLIRHPSVWLTGAEKRTADELRPFITAPGSRGKHPAKLTAEGEALLAEWDATHGEVES